MFDMIIEFMNKKYKVNKKFIIQKLDGKIVIFDGEKSILNTLNSTASFMFQKIKLGWDKGKIIDAIVKSYSIDEKTVSNDLEKMIKELEPQR